MSSSLDQVVDIDISRATLTVTRAGFGVILIIAPASASGLAVGDNIEASEPQDVLDAGFTVSDAAYVMAKAAFDQDPRPEKVLITPVSSAVAQVDTITPTAVNSFAYAVTINGTVFAFTADGSATVSEVVTGLIAAINAGSEPVTASGTTTLILTSDIAGTGFVTEVGSNLALVHTTANDGVQANILAAIQSGWDFYGVLISSRTEALILQAAATVEGNKKLLFVSQNDANVKAGTAGNTLKLLKAQNYDRTVYLWSDDQSSFPDSAWMGDTFPLDPGKLTFKFRNLNSVEADQLTDTQISNIEDDNGNTYRNIGGVGVTGPGVVVSGEWIDVIRDIDWLEVRMQEDVVNALIQNDKIPFTDAGGSIIENIVRKRLLNAVAAGVLSSFTITVPKVADIPSEDRAARFFTGVEFDGVLASAIHKVKIRGRVSV